MKTKIFGTIFVIITLSGCCGHTITNVGLDDIEKGIKTDFKNMGYVSFSDLMSDDEKIYEVAKRYIRKQQCFFDSANPMLVSSMDKMDLVLKGVITTKGEIRIAAQPEGSFGGSSQFEQIIPWPVTAVSLGSVPDRFLATKMGKLNDFKDIFTTIDDTRKKILTNQILDNYYILKEKIENLQKTFDPSTQCTK